jgi:hypothetical protein
MHPYEYTIRFLIVHPNNNLNEISETLSQIPGIVAAKVSNAGEDMVDRNGDKLGTKYFDSRWGFSFFEGWQKSENETLPSCLDKVIAKLQPHKEFLNRLANEAYHSEIIVSWSVEENVGDSLSPELMGKFADLKLHLGFDLYPPDEK